MEYQEFIEHKLDFKRESGFDVSIDDLTPMLFDYQKDLVRWALKLGKAALFTMTGTGKSFMEIEFARQVHKKTGKDIIIIAPLAVGNQIIEMAKLFKIDINNLRHNNHKSGINIINYEQLHKINSDDYGCVILDESSILKNYMGKTKSEIIDMFQYTPYKLCATATPSPNDYMELGNHSEFLDVLKRNEMLSMFFINDASDTGRWRLKGHSEKSFWEWIASWAAILTKPSDLDYDDSYYQLPNLNVNEVIIETGLKLKDSLFVVQAETLDERREARRLTVKDKVIKCAEMINSSNDIWLIWCDLNIESGLIKKNIKDCVEVKGGDDNDFKENAMSNFAHGKIKCLVTKPSIAGFGMNWQVCNNMCFIGLSDSFELYFQAVRRCYRFGQKNDVNVFIFSSDLEGAILDNVKNKEMNVNKMIEEMVNNTKNYVKNNIKKTGLYKLDYIPDNKMRLPNFIRSEK